MFPACPRGNLYALRHFGHHEPPMSPSRSRGSSQKPGEDPVVQARQIVAGAKTAITRTNQAIARLSASSRARPTAGLANDDADATDDEGRQQ